MLNLDLSKVEVQSNDFNLLPEGKYVLTLNEAELKDTKSGTGQYISTQFRVKSGDYKGRCVFFNFNIKNDNVKAVEIGLSQLKKMLVLSGRSVDKLTDVAQIVGCEVGAFVKVKTDSYGSKNDISYFLEPTDVTASSNDDDGLPF